MLHVLLVMATAPRVDTVYGGDFEAMSLDLGAASGFLSWVLPLLFAEWWIQYRKPRRRNRHARPTSKDTASSATPAPTRTA